MKLKKLLKATHPAQDVSVRQIQGPNFCRPFKAGTPSDCPFDLNSEVDAQYTLATHLRIRTEYAGLCRAKNDRLYIRLKADEA